MILKGEAISKQFIRKNRNSNVFYAVKECSIEIKNGELIEVVGRSGSGKSTLLNMLSGILTPSTGRVMLDDLDLYQLEDSQLSRFRNEHFGIVPQGYSAISSLTVLENVMLPYTLYDGEEDGTDRAKELLDRIGIMDLSEVYPQELSGGELRRMAIARALVRKPDILFADEPTGDLDDENTKLILELLKSAAQDGVAVLMITHDVEAKQYADCIYRMDGGELREEKCK